MTASRVYDQFPELETPRLILRDLDADDADDVLHIFGDAAVTRYYDLDTFDCRQQAAVLIERFRERYSRRIGVRWAICRRGDPDRVVGTCGYNLWVQTSHRALLGFDLARDCWRQGIMTEALTAALRFGFEAMELNRAEATVLVANEASSGLLRRLGFQLEGILREYEYLKGRHLDMAMFSLLRSDNAAPVAHPDQRSLLP